AGKNPYAVIVPHLAKVSGPPRARAGTSIARSCPVPHQVVSPAEAGPYTQLQGGHMAEHKPTAPARGESSAATPASSSRTSSSGPLSRRDPVGSSPFSSIVRLWNGEMDRFFKGFGFDRPSLIVGEPAGVGAPQIEVFQRGNDLVVRADLPGLKKEDLHVDITDNLMTIQGERKHAHEGEREAWDR